MIKISRDWATPLAMGVFALMAVTGLLMFFHLDQGLNKLAHEWLGWLMVAGVAAHALANWPAFKRHLQANPGGRAILGLSLLVTALSFVTPPGAQGGGASTPQLAIRALTQAPLAQLAPLAGRTVAQAQADLQAVGIALAGPEATLAQATQGDRARMGQALAVLFAAP